MIVAAGLGTRLKPLTDHRPKPALPVRGLPLVAYTLALLRHHGVSEVVINLHHRPEILEEVARRHCPDGLALHFSREETLLDTGGGIRRVVGFLRESDPCLLIGGDMLLDADLAALVSGHRERDDAVTMLLREDPRVETFGSVGVDAAGSVRRIGSRYHFGAETGAETRAGIYTWANVVSARAFDSLPDEEVFGHFDRWIAPMLERGARDVRGDFAPCLWEPVGTLPEYLAVNLTRARTRTPLSYLDPEARARKLGVRFEHDSVIGAGAKLGAGASLRRAVVWDGEQVPAGARVHDGVFAAGTFHPVPQGPSA